MKVGFIGLGIMGRPMAVNLAKAGHALFAHSRGGVPREVFDAGGVGCGSGKERESGGRRRLTSSREVAEGRRC